MSARQHGLFKKRTVLFGLWNRPAAHVLTGSLWGQQDQETSYTIIKSKETEVIADGLRPSSVYVFQIRARTSAGYGGFSQRFEFETSPYREYGPGPTLLWRVM